MAPWAHPSPSPPTPAPAVPQSWRRPRPRSPGESALHPAGSACEVLGDVLRVQGAGLRCVPPALQSRKWPTSPGEAWFRFSLVWLWLCHSTAALLLGFGAPADAEGVVLLRTRTSALHAEHPASRCRPPVCSLFAASLTLTPPLSLLFPAGLASSRSTPCSTPCPSGPWVGPTTATQHPRWERASLFFFLLHFPPIAPSFPFKGSWTGVLDSP